MHTYYGSRVDDIDLSYKICSIDRGFSGNPYEKGKTERPYSLDMLPQEYSCFGTGDYRAAALRIQNADGSQAVQLRFVGAEIVPGKYKLEGLPAVYDDTGKAQTLIVRLQDQSTGIEAELQYGVLEELDVITRAVKITNHGSVPVVLQKVASMSLDWQFGSFDWVTFHGRHAMERNIQRSTVRHGIQSIGSVRGTSSHQYNPFSILCGKETTETCGDCYGFSFLYSGEFLMEVELDQVSQTRLVCGIHPDNFAWNLGSGESFQAPEVMMTYSREGVGLLSRNLHRTIREHVCRGEWKKKRRPVLINNWEATSFDFTGEKLVSIAKEAAQSGVELFVMDDGWFGRREDDNSGLGDWYPNEKKLGCTLKELAEQITAVGMKFGIWFEPEAVSEDSDLYEQHPEWAVQIPGRKPCLSRNQLMLDISQTAVQDYMIGCLSKILSDVPISYVKWDLNRSICDKYSQALGAQHQGEFAHRYVLGLYRILETLVKMFPHVLFEGCSGGGGRFDAGMLYYTPQIWCSDNTDAINRLSIQYGTSFGYPVSTVGSHVSAVPNLQTGRRTSLSVRACVAMSGTFGYELDITKMTDAEKAEIRQQIDEFHEFYELIQYGDYYRLTDTEDACTVWEFADPQGREALVNMVFSRVEANPVPISVSVRGLREHSFYRAELLHANEFQREPERWFQKDIILSGAALQYGGLTLPPTWKEYQMFQIRLNCVDEK